MIRGVGASDQGTATHSQDFHKKATAGGPCFLQGDARSIVYSDSNVNTSGIDNDTRSPVLGPEITSELIRAARALLRWEQRHLSQASSVSLPTIKRLEAKPGILAAHHSTVAALKRALETAGIEFTNGASPGVRLRPVRKDSVSKPPNSANNN
jgi:hypothetical protein